MTDIFLYAGEAKSNDVRLLDPTVLASGGIAAQEMPDIRLLSSRRWFDSSFFLTPIQEVLVISPQAAAASLIYTTATRTRSSGGSGVGGSGVVGDHTSFAAFQFRPSRADYMRKLREMSDAKDRAARGLGINKSRQEAARAEVNRRAARLEEEKRTLDERLAAFQDMLNKNAEEKRATLADLERRRREASEDRSRADEERRRRERGEFDARQAERTWMLEEHERAFVGHERKLTDVRKKADEEIRKIWEDAQKNSLPRPTSEAIADAEALLAGSRRLSDDEVRMRMRLVIETLLGVGAVGVARALGRSTVPGALAVIAAIVNFWRTRPERK